MRTSPDHRKAPWRLVLLTPVLLVSVMSTALQLPQETAVAAQTSTERRDRDARPNILLITTDDQRLSDLRHMPRTRRLIGNHGATFTGISPHPLCCPARAEILTGQYAQNNGVRSNRGKYGGYKRLNTRHTVATWMNRAGYHTMFLGKFLNGYARGAVRDATPGWDDWNATMRGTYDYRRFSVNHNGRLRGYRAYQTDYFTDLAVDKLRSASKRRAPFFLWQSYVAPHASCAPRMETSENCWTPPGAARRHRRAFADAIPPSMLTRAFNERSLADKPFPMNTFELLDSIDERRLRILHRNRLRSLQAVDEGIARMLRTLARTGELDNTLVIFTSDNGFLLGEHRYKGKVLPYEPSLQIPLLVRGPGVPKGVVRRRIGTLIDLAPTILAAGDARATRALDGRNLLPVARRNARSWGTVLIQAGPRRPAEDEDGWFYRGVRTNRFTFARYLLTDEVELYDRRRDPHQLRNVALNPRYRDVVRELRRRTNVLGRCEGRGCRRDFGPVPALLPEDLIEPTEAEATPTEPTAAQRDESPPARRR